MEKYNLTQTGQEVQNILDNAIPQSDLATEVERAQEAEGLLGEGIQQNADDIDAIEGKIPSAATSENKLATESYVNDAVATSSATFRGTFNLVSDLSLTVDATEQQIATALAGAISTADNNDYAFVQIPTSDETPTEIAEIDRYKFNGTAWSFEYKLNNSGFTEAQWEAINSGITSELVTKLGNLPTAAALAEALASKQNVLTFDSVPTEGSNNPVKSGGVYSAIDEEKGARLNSDAALQQSIEAILLLIPTAASSLNQLADKNFVNSSISTATATPRGTYNLVSDLDLTTDATRETIAEKLGEVIDVADLNDYAFVQVPVSDDVPAEIERTERYKFNGNVWIYEYTLNTSGFTAAQWAAINSGITIALVAKLNGLPTAEALELALGAITQSIQNISAVIPTEAAAQNQLADKAYVLDMILSNISAFKGQYTSLTQLESVEDPKNGDLGIVRTKDDAGHDVFTFYQYKDGDWVAFFDLSYHPQDKHATTGILGDYPYNGMGRVELPKNMVDGWLDNTWVYLPKNGVVYLLYSWNLQLYAVYNTSSMEGLGLDNNLVIKPSGYDITEIEGVVNGRYLSFTEDDGIYNISIPDGGVISSIELNNTNIYNYNDPTHQGVNLLVQSMINQDNTIYVIQYDFTLGENITIPANCVLEFDGGSLSNGTIVGNYTTIKASPIKIFGANMLFSGTWNIGATFVEWFDTGNQADDFEKANSLGTTHLLIGKFYIFDRQVSVSNSVIGDGRIPSIIAGGATTKNETSTIIYIGNGGETSVTPPAEAGDSILLIHDKNGIEIRNINFVTSTEANIDVPNLSVTSVFLDNPKFSAIKMTTEGASLRGNIISSCKFEELPIGVNIYDLSQGTIYQYEVNSDNNNIENCWFSHCGIGIQLYNTNAYNTILYKCYFYGSTNTYRHINLLKGTFVSIEGYFGPLSSTIEGIKAAIYVDDSHYYTMITPYAECHHGYFIYDNSNVGPADKCNKALLNPVVKSGEIYAPTVDGHKVCVYLGGSDHNTINMYGGTFTLSAYVNQGILNLFGTNILLNIFRNSSNNAKVNKSFCPTGNTSFYSGQVDAVAETSTFSVGGATNTSSCAQLIYDNKNKKMRLGLSGIGYVDATYNSGGSWIDFGPFGIYLEPKTINSEQRARTIGGFVRNSDINANHFSLGVFDAWKKLRDVFGNLVGTKYEGPTAQRPTGVHYGTSYFDTDLGKPIWWLVNETYPNGTWVDATGATV